MRVERAVLLLSGGIDSAVTLYYAKSKGYKIYCLSFDYGQRHGRELLSAKRIAGISGSDWKQLKISLPWKGSALLDKKKRLPGGSSRRRSVPDTYVPGRNIIFLSYAVSYAETIGAKDIFIGANQIDYSGYPDCRSPFLKVFEDAVNKGTKQGARGGRIRIKAPLINKSKADIITEAVKLRVPLKHTWSCYEGARHPCRRCDSCIIRRDGFKKADVKDPLTDGQR